MRPRAPIPAVAFVGALLFFAVAASPIISLISPVHAQSGAPVFDSSADYTRSIDENKGPYDTSGGGTPSQGDRVLIGDPVTATGAGVTYTLDNGGASDFGIDFFSGQLMVGNPLDYEEQASHTVTVIATNDSGTARQSVTINVNNLDEPEKVTLMWKPSGSDVELEAKLSDGDVVTGTPTWQWSESDSQSGTYTDIGSATSATYTNSPDHEYLKATATYTDSHGSGKTASATVGVERPSNFPTGYELEFGANTSGGYACPHRHTGANYNNQNADICRSIARNATPEDRIYYPASVKYTHATENDRYPFQGSINYSLSGDDAAKFEIDPTNGDLFPKGTHQYNSPGPDEVFLVTITATHPSGGDEGNDSIDIALKPSGSNNNPVIQGPQDIRYPENGTWQVAKYTAEFSDSRQTVGWIIGVEPGGGDGDYFDIDDNGVLSFTQRPDYDQGQREFSFHVQAYATNGPRGETYYSVRVIVYNVDEDLEIRGPTVIKFPENSTDPIHAYTAEGKEGSLTWMLEGQDKQWFSLSSSGTLSFRNTPDYEAPFDSSDPVKDRNDYLLSITVMDDSGTTDTADDDSSKIESVRVMVTNVNEPPSFPTETATRNVNENAAVGENVGDPVTATDPDQNDYLEYSLTGDDDDASFDIDYDGQIKTIENFDYGSKNSYTVTITVTDSGGLTDQITVTIDSTEVNDPPVFDDTALTTTLSLPENTAPNTNIGSPITATDEENNTLAYTLEGDDAGSFEVGSNGQIKTKSGVTYNYEDPGDADTNNDYEVTVKASDGNSSDTIDVTITVNDINETPAFDENTSATRSIPENTRANTDIGAAIAATDPDNENGRSGDTLTYTLGGTDVASFDLDTATGQIKTSAALDKETKSSYSVTVSVRDGRDANGDSDTAEDDSIDVTITVTGENEPPVFADATTTREVPENSRAGTNVGSAITATDEDNDSLTYTLEGTDASSFQIGSTSGQIKTESGVTYDYEGSQNSYSVTVKADDKNGGTDTIDVTIDLTNVNEHGTITFNPTQPKAGTALVATLTDPDGSVSGETWKWSIAPTATGTFAVISGETSGTYTPAATDVGQYLKVEVSYTDPEASGQNAEATTSAVIAANTPPTFPGGDNPTPITLSVDENSDSGTVVGTVAATESDTDDTLTYSLDGEAAEITAFNAAFSLDTSTGKITVLADESLDHETTGSYTFDIEVSDGKNAADLSDTTVDTTVEVTINVTDVNEPPAFNDTPNTRTVAENTGAGLPVGDPFTATDPDEGATLTYILGGSDKDSFTIDSTGQIKTKTGVTYNHEAKETYSVTVSVHDGKDEHGDPNTVADETVNVTITVSDQDEPGIVTFGHTQPQVRTALQATLTDEDGITGTTTWQWYRDDSATGTFADAISDATSDSYTPVTADANKYLKAKATYNDNYSGAGTDKYAEEVTDNKVQAFHNPNDAPTFSSNTMSFDVAENTGPGVNIGTPVTANDPNIGDRVVYSLDATSDEVFEIDQTSGQLQTEGPLDYETKESYTVTITATDPGLLTGTKTVTIKVTDAEEAPGKPDAPTLAPRTGHGHEVLTAAWDPPPNTGPDLTEYEFQYRKRDVQEWTKQAIATSSFANPANPTLDITTLLPETTYFARVQATNGEGTGEWSEEGEGTTDPKPTADWFDLIVDYSAATYSVTEGSTVTITVQLSESGSSQIADRKISLPITVTAGTAETGDYTINGLDGSNNLAFVPGENSKTFTIKADADADADDETLTLGFGTNLPTKLTLGTTKPTATITITDYDAARSNNPPPPQRQNLAVRFSSSDYTVNEGETATITVQMSPAPSQAITIPVTASGGTAEAGDYTVSSTSLSLSAGSSSKTFTVTANQDDDTEAETLTLGFGNLPGGVTAGSPSTATLTINDDDTPVVGTPLKGLSVRYSAARYTVTEGSTATITIQLSPAPDQGVSIPVTASGGTAEAGDYTVSASSVTFGPGSSSQTFTVTANQDDDSDAETLTLGFGTLPNGAAAGSPSSATLTINDDDTPVAQQQPTPAYSGTVSFSAADYAVTEGSTATITVQLSPAPDQGVSIPVTARGGTAEPDDYSMLATGVTFGTGATSGTFAIATNHDADSEAETLSLGFGTLPNQVSTGSPSAATLTINDEDAPAVSKQPPPRRRSGLTRRGSRGGGGARISNEQRPPVFMEGPSTTRWVPENTLNGVNFGFPVMATDPNQDPLTYILIGGDRTSFAVDPPTGQLSTSAPLDYETKADYSVTMVVTDGRGGQDSIVVLIAVTDVNEIAYDPATKTVALITVEDGASLTTPDGSGSVVFPDGTRNVPYYACIGQGSTDCARDAPEGNLHVYATIDIFDMAGNLLEDLTLDQPVTILLRVNAADLGGLERALQIHEYGGFKAYTRTDSSEDWTEVDFTLFSNDTGAITVFITGIRDFSCFVVVVDASVLPPPVNQVIAAPGPRPTPVAEPPLQAAAVAPTPVPPAAVVQQDPPIHPPVAQPEEADDPFGPEAPLLTFRDIVDFAMDIPLWLLILLAIAAPVWAAILRAYVVWRRNHPPPPKYRNNKPQLGRDLLAPGG